MYFQAKVLFTNVLMVLIGIVGFIINLYLKKREESKAKISNQKEKVAEA